MCHLCDKIVTGDRDEHIAGQRHTSNLALVGAQAEELPWVRVSRYLTNPTADQEAQIHRSDMEEAFRGLHHVFGDLWTQDMTDSYSTADVAVTTPVAPALLTDDELFYYDADGDEVPRAVLVSAGLKRR
jgi:hypothetical protein